jgi:hypothetical protein
MQRVLRAARRQLSTSAACREAEIPKTARELIAVTRLSDTTFQSAFNPQRHGSTQAISYGGIPLSLRRAREPNRRLTA